MHALLPGNDPVQVIQAVRGQQQRAISQEATFFAIIELAYGGRQAAQAGQFGVAVIQRCGAQGDAVGGDLPAQVGQQLSDTHDQRFVADQRAVSVVQRSRCQREIVGAGDLAALVIDDVQISQQQLTGSGYLPTLVVQQAIAHIQADIAVAVQAPVIGLIEARNHGSQSHGAGNTTGVTVVDQPGIQLECAGTGQAAVLMVVEDSSTEHQTFTGNTTAPAVIEAATGECQLCIADYLSTLVDHRTVEIERTCAGTAHTAVGVGQTGCFEVHCAITAQYALIVLQHTAQRQVQRILSVNAAPSGIVQLPQVQLHALLTGNDPVQVVQAVSSQQQRATGQQAAFFTVIELTNVGRQTAKAGYFAIAVVQ